MTSIWGGTAQRTVHCDGAAPEAITASLILDWSTVNLGTNSLSRFLELDARNGSVSIRVPANPGIAHNGRKIKIAVNNDDPSTVNFRGVIFTGGSPIERGVLPVQTTYALDRKSGHLVIQVVNGVARIKSGASFNQDPALPNNAALLATLNSWTTGATWTDLGNGEAVVQFNANGTFAPQRTLSAWSLVAAGGGGGGRGETHDFGGGGGGGGGGGVLENTALAIAIGTYAITIGAGGVTSGSSDTSGTRGGASSIGSLVVTTGGGGGGAEAGNSEINGGSGGGQGGDQGSAAGTGTAGQGSGGGNRTNRAAGGGGGRTSAGGNALADRTGGTGGAGLASLITGVSLVYGSGGGGGTGGGNGSAGGVGGNGAGSGGGPSPSGAAATNGTANRGGGGGGGRADFDGGTQSAGGTGGTGVIVLRVPLVAAIGL